MADNPCVGCKFAEWKMTAAGRLHPDKSGQCVWSPSVPAMPAVLGRQETDTVTRLLTRPRFIERGEWPTGECAVRENRL